MSKDNCNCNNHNHALCAARVPIFSSLDKEELEQVVSLIVQKTFEKDEIIFSEGSLSEKMIIINKGRIKVFGNSEDGKEQIMYILSDGDFIGERNLIQQKESCFSAQAMEETLVCMIGKQDFQKLLIKYPSISIKIVEALCGRLEKMESLVRKISPKDVDSRINMMLLELAQKYGRNHNDGILVELPMSREEMANYIGVARETVSRKLTSLKDEGIIKMIGNKKMLIINEEALESSN